MSIIRLKVDFPGQTLKIFNLGINLPVKSLPKMGVACECFPDELKLFKKFGCYLAFLCKIPLLERALGLKAAAGPNVVCNIPLLARRTRPQGQARRATIEYLVYKAKRARDDRVYCIQFSLGSNR